jgi:hypothetical protein
MSGFGACLVLALLNQAPAESSATSSLEQFLQEAQGYDIRLGGRSQSKLELSPKPLLHWDNPAANGEDGAVYVWMLDGRPEVIGTMFTLFSRGAGQRILKHSLHSLASGPLTADHLGQRVWTPNAKGLDFRPIADAPDPAGSSRLRLLQMKSLAKDFSGKLVDLKDRNVELRLLPQPIIRYEPTRADVQDGAIFALAEGTDPQALVVIEARRHESQWRWEAAFARFHFVTLYGYHKQQEVWRVDPDPSQMRASLGDPQQMAKIYISLQKK